MNLLKIAFLLFLVSQAVYLEAATTLDFDGDGKSDFAVINTRRDRRGYVKNWYIARSSDGVVVNQQWGIGCCNVNEDVPVAADYDGDGKTDVAIWRASSLPGASEYHILQSADFTTRIEQFGQQYDDFRAVGDYDGDGKADLAVYRPTSPGLPNYFIFRGSFNNPSGNVTYVQWGSGYGDTPYYGDFDGDRKLDFCIRQFGTARFALLRSSDLGTEFINWGLSGDALSPGDYDGDRKSDFCVRRFVDHKLLWFILERDGGGTGMGSISWGHDLLPLDIAYGNGDYDGDGKTDIGVYRLTENPLDTFLIRRSSNASALAYPLGAPGDVPVNPLN